VNEHAEDLVRAHGRDDDPDLFEPVSALKAGPTAAHAGDCKGHWYAHEMLLQTDQF